MNAAIPGAYVLEKLATFITNRRDKRIITFGVLGLYVVVVIWHLVGPLFGLPQTKLVMDSVESMAMVVVVAHIVGSVGTRAAGAIAMKKAKSDG